MLEDNQSLRKIEKIARTLNIIYSKKLKNQGLQRGQYSFLIFINENPGLSQFELVSELNIDKTTVAKALKKMENDEVIFRQKDLDDHRIMRAYPTEKGRLIYQNILNEENEIISKVLSTFSEREKSNLVILLNKIEKNIEKEWKDSRIYISTGSIRKAEESDLIDFKQNIVFNKYNTYYIYIYKNKTVGYIELNWTIEESVVYIENMYILESFQGKGFGYELLKEINNILANDKISHIKILVDEKNIPMLKLINLLEYRFVGESENKYCFEKIR
ncbi:MAG: GNAT family N-acetyltransferase [Clostridiales bacterium]|nr:GNAT family N-acetyltransferase [Clostridiales bacterium]